MLRIKFIEEKKKYIRSYLLHKNIDTINATYSNSKVLRFCTDNNII